MPKIGCGGYCETHKQHDPGFIRKKAKVEARKVQSRIIKSMPIDKLILNNGANEFQLLQNFYGAAMLELSKSPFCAECEAWIPSTYYRAAIAHILPKRKEYGFPSIASHPLNKIFLGAGCGCHKKYDNTWTEASKMKVWDTVIIIFKELYPSIATEEYKNIPDVLIVHIPGLN